MVNLIKPYKIKTKVKDGEVQVVISLDVNVHVDSSGDIRVSSTSGEIEEKKDIDEPEYQMPDFSNLGKINFGKPF